MDVKTSFINRVIEEVYNICRSVVGFCGAWDILSCMQVKEGFIIVLSKHLRHGTRELMCVCQAWASPRVWKIPTYTIYYLVRIHSF